MLACLHSGLLVVGLSFFLVASSWVPLRCILWPLLGASASGFEILAGLEA